MIRPVALAKIVGVRFRTEFASACRKRLNKNNCLETFALRPQSDALDIV